MISLSYSQYCLPAKMVNISYISSRPVMNNKESTYNIYWRQSSGILCVCHLASEHMVWLARGHRCLFAHEVRNLICSALNGLCPVLIFASIITVWWTVMCTSISGCVHENFRRKYQLPLWLQFMPWEKRKQVCVDVNKWTILSTLPFKVILLLQWFTKSL